MRFLVGADVPPNPDSGAAGTVYQTIRALRNLGHEVDELWAADLGRRIQHGNFHYLLELPFAYRREVAKHLQKRPFDAVILSQPYAWLAGLYIQRHYPKTVFINRSHGWEPRIREVLHYWRARHAVFSDAPASRWSGFSAPLHHVLNRVYPANVVRYADGLVVSCTEDRDYIRSVYSAPDHAVKVVPLAPAESFVLNEAKGLSPERRNNVLYVGQATFFKAPHVLAAVYSRLAEQFSEMHFTWCCPDTDHARCRALLSSRAAQRTQFVGWMSQKELVTLYDRHGYFIFPPYTEGFGKVFLEAMCRGLCVIASRTAGMKDVIEDNENGCLVEPGDTEAFCDRVAHLYEDSRKMDQMSRFAIKTASAHTWQQVASDIADYCQQLQKRKERSLAS